VDHVALAKILTRMNAAREAQALRLPELTQALRHPVASVWDRLSEEAEKQTRRLPLHDGLRRSAEQIREMQPVLERIGAMDAETSATMVEAAMMSPEAEALARAWMDGASGAKPPPPEVMALFDLLVHDTMLTSWHDHILSSTLYFQTRATDGFGKSDVEKEARQREADERAAQRVDRLPKMSGVPTARP
jgi:hypothetical protein